MKHIVIITMLITVGLSSCGTTKQASDSKRMSKAEFMQVDSLAEVMPTFMGGNIVVFRNWLASQLKYPQQVFEDYSKGYLSDGALSGTVTAAFIIEGDGSIKEVNILSSPNHYFGRTVENLIRNSPPWTPGYQGGKAVRVRYIFPVEFRLPPGYIESLRRQRDRNSNRSNSVNRY